MGGSSLPIHRLSISFPLMLEASGSHWGCLGTCWDEAHKLPLGACTEAWLGSGSYYLGALCVPGPTGEHHLQSLPQPGMPTQPSPLRQGNPGLDMKCPQLKLQGLDCDMRSPAFVGEWVGPSAPCTPARVGGRLCTCAGPCELCWGVCK